MTDRQITHAPGCWGPRHYECALREIELLVAERDALRDFVEAKMHHLPIEDQHVASILVGEQGDRNE